MIPTQTIREPIVDGIFYPEKSTDLKKEIERLLDQARHELSDGKGTNDEISKNRRSVPEAIISPHASYDYCGDIMAAAYRSVSSKDVDIVVLIGPVHRERQDEIYITESHLFRTPLGDVSVDLQFTDELIGFSSKIIKNDIPHLEEHCLETQLPFIQYIFPQATIVPILMGSCKVNTTEKLVQALQFAEANNDKHILYVASVNLSAYVSKDDAEKGAKVLTSLINEKNWQEVIAAARRKEIHCCGAPCVAAVLALLGKNVDINTEKTGDSDRIKQEDEKVVYYSGISFSRVRQK